MSQYQEDINNINNTVKNLSKSAHSVLWGVIGGVGGIVVIIIITFILICYLTKKADDNEKNNNSVLSENLINNQVPTNNENERV